jgi:hypothetical protein
MDNSTVLVIKISYNQWDYLGGLVFLLWVLRGTGARGGGGGGGSQCITQFIKCVLKDVPNNTSFLFSYCLAIVHGAVEWRGEHDKACIYFGERSILRLLCWGIVPMFQKYQSWLTNTNSWQQWTHSDQMHKLGITHGHGFLRRLSLPSESQNIIIIMKMFSWLAVNGLQSVARALGSQKKKISFSLASYALVLSLKFLVFLFCFFVGIFAQFCTMKGLRDTGEITGHKS